MNETNDGLPSSGSVARNEPTSITLQKKGGKKGSLLFLQQLIVTAASRLGIPHTDVKITDLTAEDVKKAPDM